MSGFSASWLALREGADHRARDAGLARRLSAHLAARETQSLVDIGCGTGSNLRALAPHLGARQDWRLVDYDPALLAAARAELTAWADRTEPEGEGLVLTKDGRTLTVRFVQADLAAGLESVLDPVPHGLTAAAFFDLASPDFIRRTARAAADRGIAFLTVLTYDGTDDWQPPHPADAAMNAAFHAHQGGDKGFGPAAGPDATRVLREAFTSAGYAVTTAPTPWRLGSADAALLAELARGYAGAVRETGRVPEGDIASWLAARLGPGTTCTVGHHDLLALPPG